MGKPFAQELAELPKTYRWANEVKVDALANWAASSASLPLMAIGSGGSLTSAYVAAGLHQQWTGNLAKATTPLQAVSSGVRNVSVLFATAGGSNPDILGAFRHVVAAEPATLGVASMRKPSPLGNLASKSGWVDVAEFAPPFGKDGFLATNSLLAMAVLLTRAYAAAWSFESPLPDDFAEIVSLVPLLSGGSLADSAAALWDRDVLIVLHGPATQAAAADLESKFTEAALGTVQVADYRNFAHGRHHWLAKRGVQSAVLAITSPDDRELAHKTLSLLPPTVPKLSLGVDRSGRIGTLAALVAVFHLVRLAGDARGMDPGRPGVPSFGRRIYNLRAIGMPSRSLGEVPRDEAIAIVRKVKDDFESLTRKGELPFWRRAFGSAVRSICASAFGAVVLDYDGTLCDSRDRYVEGLREDIATELSRLLAQGILVAVATGRGKSVRKALQAALPRSTWAQVQIGYYNGAQIASLADDVVPTSGNKPTGELSKALEVLLEDPALQRLADSEVSEQQITLTPCFPGGEHAVWARTWEVTRQAQLALPVVRSSHSVDVLAPAISKLAVVNRVRGLLGGEQPVLCIGDRGSWPGNDHELLAGADSLSADEVSIDPRSAWNLAPAGRRGVEATLGYLRALQPAGSGFRLQLRVSDRSE